MKARTVPLVAVEECPAWEDDVMRKMHPLSLYVPLKEQANFVADSAGQRVSASNLLFCSRT